MQRTENIFDHLPRIPAGDYYLCPECGLIRHSDDRTANLNNWACPNRFCSGMVIKLNTPISRRFIEPGLDTVEPEEECRLCRKDEEPIVFDRSHGGGGPYTAG